MSDWYVYIMSNSAHTLYIGATNDLPKRVHDHKVKTYPSSFTARYTFDKCVYYEQVGDQSAASARERQIKGWPRRRRVALIQSINPDWHDLSARWSLDRLFS